MIVINKEESKTKSGLTFGCLLFWFNSNVIAYWPIRLKLFLVFVFSCFGFVAWLFLLFSVFLILMKKRQFLNDSLQLME